MVQVKKTEVRERILQAAAALFAEHTYARATINQIAKTAGIAPSNVYVYFKSKLEIMFAVYEPWFRQQIDRLAHLADEWPGTVPVVIHAGAASQRMARSVSSSHLVKRELERIFGAANVRESAP